MLFRSALLEALELAPTGDGYSVDWLKKKLDDGDDPEHVYELLCNDLDKLDRLQCKFKPMNRIRRKTR